MARSQYSTARPFQEDLISIFLPTFQLNSLSALCPLILTLDRCLPLSSIPGICFVSLTSTAGDMRSDVFQMPSLTSTAFTCLGRRVCARYNGLLLVDHIIMLISFHLI
jgi:hypothetical protein